MAEKATPERTCIACRRKGPKSTLVRVSHGPDNRIVVEPSGYGSGRGAYLCRRRECLSRLEKPETFIYPLRLKERPLPPEEGQVERIMAATIPERSGGRPERGPTFDGEFFQGGN